MRFVTRWPRWFLQKSGWTPAQLNRDYFIFHRPWTKDPGRWTNQYGSWFMECQGFSFGSCSHCQEQTSLACAGGLSKDVSLQLANPKQPFDGVCFFFRNRVEICGSPAASVGISNFFLCWSQMGHHHPSLACKKKPLVFFFHTWARPSFHILGTASFCWSGLQHYRGCQYMSCSQCDQRNLWIGHWFSSCLQAISLFEPSIFDLEKSTVKNAFVKVLT